ncbi:MAG: hypothetical protein ABMA13_06105 [Chthoniobacteraceae bacterium]
MNTTLLSRALALLALAGLPLTHAATLTYDPQGASMEWSEVMNWLNESMMRTQFPSGAGDTAIITGGELATLSTDITIGSLTFTGMPVGSSTIASGGFTLNVLNSASLTGAIFSGGGTLDMNTVNLAGLLSVNGTNTVARAMTTTFGAAGGIFVNSGGTFRNGGSMTLGENNGISSSDGTGTLLNRGSLAKTTGTGLATVSARVDDDGAGTITVSAGTLSFTGSSSFNGSRFGAESGATLSFAGSGTAGTGFSGARFTVTGGGRVTISGGDYQVSGTLTSGGDGTGEVLVNGSVTLSNTGAPPPTLPGTLDFSPQAPLAFETGQIGFGGLTNAGAFIWRGGTIASLVNSAPAGLFTITALPSGGPRIASGLSNTGFITQAGGFQIGTPDLTNQSSGVFEAALSANSASISQASGGTGGFVNLGNVNKTGTNNLTVFTPFTNGLNGDVFVTDGQVFLRGINTLDGDLRVDRTTSSTARLTIGGGGNSSTLNSPIYTLTAGGVVEFSSGFHVLVGNFPIFGTGTVEQTAGTIQISTASILTTDTMSRLLLNGSSAVLLADAEFTNQGLIEWDTATVRGSSILLNSATGNIQILGTGTAQLGDSSASGRVENEGVFAVQSGNTFLLDDNSVLLNRANSATQFLQLIGSARIREVGGVADGEMVRNEGKLIKTGAGTAQIEVVYEQNASGRIEVREGGLRFTDPTSIPDGSVAALSTGGVGAVIEFDGTTTFGSVGIEFENNSRVEFAAGGTTYTLAGTLTGAGQGSALLSAGTFTAGASNGRLNFAVPSRFEQTGGFLGSTGMLLNDGVLLKNGGTLTGPFTNATTGAFTWQSGSIGGAFTNLATTAPLQISTAGSKTLLTGGAFSNSAKVEHNASSTVALESNATLTNAAGSEYSFRSTSGTTERVQPAGGATNTMFSNEGTVLKLTVSGPTPGSTAIISTGFTNTNGTVDVREGTLSITGPATINGATWKVDGADLLDFTGGGSISGTILHDLPGGSVRYRTGLYQLAATLQGSDISGGSVLFNASFNVTGSTILDFERENATFSSSSVVLQAGTSLTNKETLNIQGGSFLLNTNASLVNERVLNFDSGTGPTFTTAALATGAVYRNQGTVFHTGTGNVSFDQRALFQNDGSYSLTSDADILAVPLSTETLFRNPGLFTKNAAGLSIFSVPFDNTGTVVALFGDLSFTGGVAQFNGSLLSAGAWEVHPGASLNLGPGTLLENDASILVRGNGQFVNFPSGGNTAVFQNDGTLRLRDGAIFLTGGNFDNNGTLEVGAMSTLTVGGTFDNNGSALINGTLNYTSLAFFTNGLFGGGVVNGNVINRGPAGPGTSPGTLTINGAFEQQSTGTLGIEIGGLAVGTASDLLAVSGPVTLSGTLSVTILYEAFGLPPGSTFTIVTGSSITGTFAMLDIPREPGTETPAFSVQYFPTAVQLTALITLPEPGAVGLLAAGALVLGARRRRGR